MRKKKIFYKIVILFSKIIVRFSSNFFNNENLNNERKFILLL